MNTNMSYETLRNSMSVQDAARVLKDTNCCGTMDIAKNVILKALEEQPCEKCCNGNQTEKAKLCQKSYIAGMEQPRWIPVSESMPPIGQDVLVCDVDGDMYITYLHLNGTWGFEYCGNKIKNVVAWQELPPSYQGESEDKDD